MRNLLTEIKYLIYIRNFEMNEVLLQCLRYFIRLYQIVFIYSGVVYVP